MQSRGASCGPCCAVTLLRHCGIEADEREMSDLCLTTKSGTPSLGLYRGLKLKTNDTPWDVEVVRGDLEQLCESGRPRLCCSRRLPDWRCRAPGYRPECRG